ncbi:MAG: hypothetical protein M3063_15065 [Actinomycetota bacterium]|nr:hypothetical protein [Actinomycetota bacterium]
MTSSEPRPAQSSRRRRRGASLRAATLGLVAVVAMVAAPLSGSASADAAGAPVVTTGEPTTVYTTGAAVTATINPNGTDTLYQIAYGPAGGTLSSMTPNMDAGAGSSAVTVPVVLEGLSPNTAYSYQVSAFVNATGTAYAGNIVSFTTNRLPSGPAQPIVPPADPAANGIFDGTCATDATCVSDVNGVRAAQENLGPIALPTNWATLTPAEQLFVLTNLERTSRGEPAIPDLVNTYDASVQTGMLTDKDPLLAGVPAGSSIWGQGATPTAVMYGWMYADGLSTTPGSGNVECTPTNSSGCWGHRNNILANATAGSGNPNEMDAVAGTDNNGQLSYAATFAVDPTPPPAGSPALVYTWAAEQPFLAGGSAAPTGLKAPEGRVCNDCNPPLVYDGGALMGTATTVGEATVTPIFWSPGGPSDYSPAYTSLINGYLTNVDAASGSSDNVYSVNTEYYQTINGQNTNIKYLIHAGAEHDDTNTYPTEGCKPAPKYTACVTDAQLQTELTAYLTANNLPTDSGHLYPVFFPPGVETVKGNSNSISGYCGYHNAFASPSGQVLYGNEPSPIDGCRSGGQTPNGDPNADAAIDTLSHEINESITDPSGGWTDSAKPANENADECANNFGVPLGSTDPNNPDTTRYNQVINGGRYYTQEEFSNASYATGEFKGCVQSAAQVAAATAAAGGGGQAARVNAQRPAAARNGTTPAAPSLNTVNVDANVYTLAADGTSTATVTVSVSDTNGDPVAGDDVSLITANLDGTQALCGTPSPMKGRTNANGDLVLTYRASTDNVSCDVVATEGRTGQSSAVQIEQGSAAQNAPTINVDFPSNVTAGAPPVTFTAQSSNPSAQPVPNTRFDLIITGDNTATQGVDARQVHLSANVGPFGLFVPVPLSGSTVGDGEIDGYVPPRAPAPYPAGGSVTTTFRLSVDANTPTSATTGTALTAEADFDQINPADGANNTLDYSVSDITIGKATPPGAYKPLTPTRIADTRTGSGRPLAGQTLPAGGTVTVNVGSQVPSTATAVALSVTAVDGSKAGFLAAYPGGTASGTTESILNFVAGGEGCTTANCVVPNLVITKLAGGQVTIKNTNAAGGTVNVVVDLEGFFDPTGATASGAGHYSAAPVPTRLIDTRCTESPPTTGLSRADCNAEHLLAANATKATVPSGGTLKVATGLKGASAAVVELTATSTTAKGYLTAYSGTGTRPIASNVNFVAGQTAANRAIVPVGTDGSINIFNYAGRTDVIVDLVGSFSDATRSPSAGALFTPVDATRLVDTRSTTAVGPGGTLAVPVAGHAGIPGEVNGQPTAAALNITEADSTRGDFLTVTPNPITPPATTSDLNFAGGQTRANADIATLNARGGINVYNHAGNTNVVVDAFGYFAAASG